MHAHGSQLARRSRIRPLLLASVAVAFGVALSACSSTSGSSATPGTSVGATKTLRIAVVAPDVSNATYWASYATAMKKAAAAKGVTLIYETGVSADDENLRLASVAAMNPQGIVLVPQSTTVNAAGLRPLVHSKIPVVTSNQFVSMAYGGAAGTNPKIHVGFNDYKYGQEQGALLVQACASKNPCNVVELDGQTGTSPQIERHAGIRSVAGTHPNIHFVTVQDYNWDQGQAVTVMSAVLLAHKNVNVVIAEDDSGALGAATAEQQAGVKGIKNIGGGGRMAAIAAIHSGSLYGTIWVSPTFDAGGALNTIIALIKKLSVNAPLNSGRPTVPVQVVQVTKQNVAQYPAQW
jgi:ribose transport system substrate-binding protein